MSRFFLDHGAIHDRVTGQHVGMHAEADWQPRLLTLLNELSENLRPSAREAAREAAKEIHSSLDQYLLVVTSGRFDISSEKLIEATAGIILKHSYDETKYQMVPRDGWQPIETAPKDGSMIFLLSAAYDDEWPEYKEDGSFEMKPVHHPAKAALGYWNPEGTSWVDEMGRLDGADICQLGVTGVWFSGGGWFQPNEVTHWMPLPSPPIAAAPKRD